MIHQKSTDMYDTFGALFEARASWVQLSLYKVNL